MKLRILAVTGLLLGAVAGGRAVADDKFKAVEIDAKKWLNPKPHMSLSRLRGNIVVLEFFATNNGECLRVHSEVAKLYDEMNENGVVIIALTDEPEAKVARFMKNYKTPFCVGTESRSQKKYGNPMLPAFAVIDPDGYVIARVHAVGDARKAIQECIDKNPPKSTEEMARIFEDEADEKLKKADELFEKKRLQDAMNTYRAVAFEYGDLESGKKADEKYRKLKSQLAETDGAAALARGDALLAKKKYPQAIEIYEKVVADYPNTSAAKKAQSKLGDLKGNTSMSKDMREKEASKKCIGWLEMARSMVRNGHPDEAKKYYEKIISQYGDTSYAETAKEEMSRL